jgi:hypothetical protein
MTCWFQDFANCPTTARAVASAAPPGAEVTMMRTGLVGKVFSQRAFYCPTRVYFPNKGSAIQSAVNGRNCS